MFVSLDFGGSTLDLVLWNDINDLKEIRSLEIAGGILDQVDFDWDAVDFIVVTGGKSRFFSDEFRGKKVIKVNEINSIGRGGRFLCDDDSVENMLVVSMGTGTCMVNVKGMQCDHVGGTGIGGGTFMGLSRELIGETDVEKLKDLFSSGETSKVDLTVQDIVGSGIGIVSGEATASNLGKIARGVDFSKSDLMSGIVNLIGQTIGTTAVFAAKSCGADLIVLTGKLTEIEQVVTVIENVGEFYGVKMITPLNGGIVSAIGAGVSVDNI